MTEVEKAIQWFEERNKATTMPGARKMAEMAISALRTQQEREKCETLKTTWETPETCPNCMEHLSLDWSFCPECGRPTAWSTNEPLTLAELRKMAGEPVWLHTFSAVQKKTSIAQWVILEAIGGSYATFLQAGCNNRLTKCFYNYGERWLAYRHKPEEGAE